MSTVFQCSNTIVSGHNLVRRCFRQMKLDKKLLDSISIADEAQIREDLAEGTDIQPENNKLLTLAVSYGAASIVQVLLMKEKI